MRCLELASILSTSSSEMPLSMSPFVSATIFVGPPVRGVFPHSQRYLTECVLSDTAKNPAFLSTSEMSGVYILPRDNMAFR